MKKEITMFTILLMTLFGCSDNSDTLNDYNTTEVFEEFWTFVDENFTFFETKNTDWDAIRLEGVSQLNLDDSEENLYAVMQDAILSLRDNHCRGTSTFGNLGGYNVAADYEVHFSSDLIFDKYTITENTKNGNIYSAILEGNVGYIYIKKFTQTGGFNEIVRSLYDAGIEGLIIDVRNNGGGDSNDVPDYLSDFVTEETMLGYYIEKSGKAHDAITSPIGISAFPSSDFYFDKKVKVITNRKSYSATSYFAAMIKDLPNVELVGQITGGGAGGSTGYQLSNGWVIAISVSDFLDKENTSIEEGVEPDFKIENTKLNIEEGRDMMLEAAISRI